MTLKCLFDILLTLEILRTKAKLHDSHICPRLDNLILAVSQSGEKQVNTIYLTDFAKKHLFLSRYTLPKTPSFIQQRCPENLKISIITDVHFSNFDYSEVAEYMYQ